MGGEGGGYGSMWAGVVGAVWVVWVAGRERCGGGAVAVLGRCVWGVWVVGGGRGEGAVRAVSAAGA